MRPENFDINHVIDSLRGTATSIGEHLPDGMEWDDLTDEDHAKLDESIFECEQCGVVV